jgi:hypothetical protein
MTDSPRATACTLSFRPGKILLLTMLHCPIPIDCPASPETTVFGG